MYPVISSSALFVLLYVTWMYESFAQTIVAKEICQQKAIEISCSDRWLISFKRADLQVRQVQHQLSCFVLVR